MSDPTLPPGSPASASPGSPGPRRIRSMPTPIRGTNLLTAATSGHSEDMNWRRGVTWLWILFGTIALAEACYVLFGALGGFTLGMPPQYELVRPCILCGVFLTLWFGWNWTRWILAVCAFLFGTGLAVSLLRAADLQLQLGGGTKDQPLPGGLLYYAPVVLAIVMYLILAVYLAFGSDVTAFTKHRREEGRGWIAVPIAFLLAAYVAAILATPLLYNLWLRRQTGSVENYGRDTLRAMSERWDSAALVARCDETLLQRISPEGQQKMLVNYVPLGPLQRTEQESSHVSSHFDPKEQRFVLQGDYTAWGQFAHGRDHYSFNLTRSLFGPWQVTMFSEDGFSVDHPPAPAPAATPAASPVPPAGG